MHAYTKTLLLLACLCFSLSLAFAQQNTNLYNLTESDNEIKGLKIRKPRKINAIPELLHLPLHLYKLKHRSTKTLSVKPIFFGKNKKQKILICESKNVPAYQNKIIFFIHGGGWKIGKPEQHLAMAEFLANSGYVVVLAGYRLTPQVAYQEMNSDIQVGFNAALLYLNKTKRFGDYKVIVGGASAGANLGALLVFDETVHQKFNIPSDIFAGFFSLAGALSLDDMPPTKSLAQYAGTKNEASFDFANPINYIDGKVQLPVLCIHGNKDGLVTADIAKKFVQKLCLYQCEMTEFYMIQGESHIGAATQWYYNDKKDKGQKALILRWLHKLNK